MKLYDDHHGVEEYGFQIRPRRNLARCQCGDDLPGRCPGVAACPHADVGDDDQLDDDDEA